jgi:hypothetical protein
MSSRRRLAAAVAAVIVALSLAGCATGASGRDAAESSSSPDVPTTAPTESATPTTTPPSEPGASDAPAPAPRPTPIPGPAGTIAFGGTCANALSVTEAGELTGQEVAASYGSTGRSDLAAVGGIRCFWDSADYMHGEILLDVYPAAVVPAAMRNAPCAAEADQCNLTATVGTAWVRVQAWGEGKKTAAVQQSVLDAVLPHLAAFPGPAAPVRDARWWALPECTRFLDKVDQPSSGFEQIMLDTSPADDPYIFLPHAVSRTCSIVGMGGVADPYNEPIIVVMTAGGAKGMPVGSDVITPLTVRGATQAVFAHLPSPIEPGPDMLVATDGVNLLQLIPDQVVDPATLTGVAGSILAALSAGSR